MFAERRQRFMKGMQDGGAALVFAAPVRNRSNDTDHRYRQDSYLHYLTGFPEPEAALLLLPGHPDHEFVMFVRPRNRERETWDGRRYGPEGTRDTFGADQAFDIAKLPEMLGSLLENRDHLYYALGRDAARDRVVLETLETVRKKVRQGVRAPGDIIDPATILDEMRLRKTDAEMALMRRAADISAEAHRAAMAALRPGMHEYEIEALIEYVFRKHGATGPAYNTIAGGGANATILHYIENTDACRAGDLLLVDAGCEVQGYAADITRTFPVSGTFTPEQRAVYDVVLASQMAAIDACRAGEKFVTYHDVAVRRLVEGLVDLKVLSGDVDGLIEREAYKPYYMHRTGHWLGLDVHDVGTYKHGETWRKLEPGMVLTVEPGLYFAEDLEGIPDALRGIGIRIEDDILVTDGEPDVLTAAAPKTADEVEAVMAGGDPVPA